MPRVALCFPGQGSQCAGMADGLLDHPSAGALLAAAERCGLDLRAALAGDDEALRPTEIAQPALLLVECVLLDQLPGDLDVVAVAGHSVGEYAASVAAGALSPGEAMRLVVARGRVMAQVRRGTMCALVGIDATAATEACDHVRRDTGEMVVVANVNAPGQVVISGTVHGVRAAVRRAERHGLRRAIPLRVSGAFHSPLIAPAAVRYARLLAKADFRDARIPLVSNVDAAAVTDARGLRARAEQQLLAPVRWVDCVERMVSLDADTLIEVGPGSVLTGLARRIAPQVRSLSVSTPADIPGLLIAAAAT